MPRTGGVASSRTTWTSPSRARRNYRRRQEFLSRKNSAERENRNAELGEEMETGSRDNMDLERETNNEEVNENLNEGSGQDVSSQPIADIIVREEECTWEVGVEPPSPGSALQNTSIDSESENKDVTDKKESNKWRINVRAEEIEKLEHHVKYERDSKVFKHCSSAAGKIVTPITSVELSLIHI